MSALKFGIGLAVMALMGLVGGALSEQFLRPAPAFGQRGMAPAVQAQVLRLVDAEGKQWGTLAVSPRGPRMAEVELGKTGPGALQIKSANGGNLIRLGDNRLEIKDPAGNLIRMDRTGIALESVGKLTMKANSQATVSASKVQANAGMVECSGVVKCDTLNANSVISSSYTPGAGNVW